MDEKMAVSMVEFLKSKDVKKDDLKAFAFVLSVLASTGCPDVAMGELCATIGLLCDRRIGKRPAWRFALARMQPGKGPGHPELEALEIKLFHSDSERADGDMRSLAESVVSILQHGAAGEQEQAAAN